MPKEFRECPVIHRENAGNLIFVKSVATLFMFFAEKNHLMHMY